MATKYHRKTEIPVDRAALFADPKGALDAAIRAATIAQPVIAHPDGRVHALVPAGFSLQDVSDPKRLPPRIEQRVTVDDRDSLSAYANRFRDARSVIIADVDAGTITASLDWHGSNQSKDDAPALSPQPNRHSVTLKLSDSEEFRRWNEMEGKMHAQADFAQFIEENVADLTDPDHSTMLEICRELEATSASSFKSGVRLENGDRTFSYETDTTVKGEIQVPTEIVLSIPLYFGEQPVRVRAKFRYRAGPGGLALGFVWHRVEYQRQATFRAMAFQAAEETGLPVYFGRDMHAPS